MGALRATAIGALALASLSYTAASAQGQQDLNRQAEQAARSSEAKLKAAVDSYRKTLSERQLVLFDASQEKWAAYREAACEFQASGAKGGSAHRMVYAYCLDEYAQARLLVITDLLKCEEGDLSCPEFRHGT